MTTTMTLANKDLAVDAEGFLKNPAEWDEAVAEAIAREAGIDPLTERHWLVVRFMRERYLTTGTAPTIRTLGKESGVPIKELYQLFPKGPAKLTDKSGGIPNPKGCIGPRLPLHPPTSSRRSASPRGSRRCPSSSPRGASRASTPD